MVGLGRFELPTSPLSGVRSNQLSYRPAFRPDDSRLILNARRQAEPDARIHVLEKVFEDQVEQLDSYAVDDHRKKQEEAEKA